MQFELQPAVESDKESIRQLRFDCYQEVVALQFGAWDEDEQTKFFEDKWVPSRYLKILCDGKFAGVLAVVQHREQILIEELQIHPTRQGRGLGTAVMNTILDDADQRQVPIRLRVLRKNRAKSMYDRLGFDVVDKTETHYLMERTIGQ